LNRLRSFEKVSPVVALLSMVCKNNRIPNDHLRKYWYHRVKTYFDDPARKQRRQKARAARAKKIAPRPVEGPLRPLVHCPTVRYNRRIRLGRGFTKDELVAAGIDAARARFLGIAVDKFRRHTKDAEIKQANIARLTQFKAAKVRVKKGETLPNGTPQPELFAIPRAEQEVKWRVITAAEKKADLFKTKTAARKAVKEEKKRKQEAKFAKK
jgi:large subunit ribosomal protein L13e